MSKKSRRVAKMRRVLFTISLVLVMMVVAVGGTMAWLQDSTTAVTNTFSKTNLDIELKETLNPDGTEETAGVTDWAADILPGANYRKNPTVTVSADSEPSWLFVEVTLSKNLANYFTYDLNLDNWTLVDTTINYSGEGDDKVEVSTTYVYGISANAGDTYPLLNKVANTNYEIVVPTTLTKEQMPSGDVTMVFDACAIQKAHLTTTNEDGETVVIEDVNAAWAYVDGLGLMAQNAAN